MTETTKTRLPWAQAKLLAEEVRELLEPACEKICIAGSIRREAMYCGDIEICCVPKAKIDGLFGEAAPIALDNAVRLHLQCFLDSDDRFQLRPNKNGVSSFGPLMAWLRYKDFDLDVFSFTQEQWAVGLLIRTGPQEHSHKWAMRRSEGGFLLANQQLKGWRILQGGVPLELGTEEEIYRAACMDYIEPRDRE